MYRFAKIAAVVATTLVAVQSASAAITTYTDLASFTAALAPGSFSNPLNGLTSGAIQNIGGNGFTATVTTSGTTIYSSGSFLGANVPTDNLTISFPANNVTAIGAEFFQTDQSDVFQATQVTVTLNDGTTRSYTPASQATSFTGFTSDGAAITSLSFPSSGVAVRYASFDNIVVGAAIPEPTTLGLLAGAGALMHRRRRA